MLDCDAGLGFRKSPNVLLFIADNKTYTDLGCYGNEDVRTPHLDLFASESLKLTRCFHTAPMCSRLRQSLYAFRYPVRNGSHPNHSRVYAWVRSLPHNLSDLGYRTAILGKRHEAPDDQFAFENLGGRHHDNGKGLDLDLSRVKNLLDDVKENDDPFCLVVASNQPHRPGTTETRQPIPRQSLAVPANHVDTEETRQGSRAVTSIFQFSNVLPRDWNSG